MKVKDERNPASNLFLNSRR